MMLATCLASVFLIAGLVSGSSEGKDERYTYSQMCILEGKLTVLHGFDCRQQVAVAKWRNSVNASGWTFLEVETQSKFEPELQAYAAGYLEGVLSREVLHYHIQNVAEDYCKNFTQYCKRMNEFVDQNQQYIKQKLASTSKDDMYWSAVNRVYHQLTGLIDGYESRPIKPGVTYEMHPILLMNWNGDFYDLEKKLNKTRDPVEDQVGGHCSGLIKVAPNNADLFISQVTMSGFQNMLRVLKLYKFGYDREFFPGYATSMASYPGLLYSSDDFALMSSGLAVIETTISVFNVSLFNHTQAVGQLPTWIRAVVANQMARDAREWCHIYAKYNSGTYNNQWAVLDYNKFTPNETLPEYGLFYVLEQMPGTIVYQDLTWFLQKYSYFPSYNIPYFKKITDVSGFVNQGKKLGDWFVWGKSPRARIFERDHSKVTDLDSLTKLMRYNNYTQDEFSRCNCKPPYSAEAAISARGDLNPANGTYEFPGQGHVNHGALDYKGTNAAMMKKLEFRAQGGPTWGTVPPFRWSTFDFKDKVKHVGHPDEWKFDWFDLKWETDVKA
ncbi:Phospholipase B [Trichostrongylus colubriformis]|uniref:Phospholipase B-like n=1 Tax=Trichostrongylus colubriformis TaxID=6319 RepID=A0AAN8J2G0_TRICO